MKYRFVLSVFASLISVFMLKAEEADSPTIIGYGPNLVWNGSFEENYKDFQNYTRNINWGAPNWDSTHRADSFDDESGTGVARTVSDCGGYFSKLDGDKRRDGFVTAIMLSRVANGLESNAFWCKVKVSRPGKYRFSYWRMNGHATYGQCATIAVDLRDNDGNVIKNIDENKIETTGLAWEKREMLVDIESAGTYQLYFHVSAVDVDKDSTAQARVRIDDVSLCEAYMENSEALPVMIGEELVENGSFQDNGGIANFTYDISNATGWYSTHTTSSFSGNTGTGLHIWKNNEISNFHSMPINTYDGTKTTAIILSRSVTDKQEYFLNNAFWTEIEFKTPGRYRLSYGQANSHVSNGHKATVEAALIKFGRDADGNAVDETQGNFTIVSSIADDYRAWETVTQDIEIGEGDLGTYKLRFRISDLYSTKTQGNVKIDGVALRKLDSCASQDDIPQTAVCRIGNEYYSSINDAIRMAPDGVETTVTLVGDIEITQSMRIFIGDNKKIRLVGGEYTIYKTDTSFTDAFYVMGELVIESGKYEGFTFWTGLYRPDPGVQDYAFNIVNGSSKWPNIIGRIVVNGGTFKNGGIQSYGDRNGVFSDDVDNCVIVNGGYFESMFLAAYAAAYNRVYGGVFDENCIIGKTKNKNARIYLHGGLYYTKFNSSASPSSDNATSTVPSGYSYDTIDDAVNGETYYIVRSSEQDVVNMTRGILYSTLGDAVAAALGGDEIRILASDDTDTSLCSIPEGKSITLSASGVWTIAAGFNVKGTLAITSGAYTGLFAPEDLGVVRFSFKPTGIKIAERVRCSFVDGYYVLRAAHKGFSVILR